MENKKMQPQLEALYAVFVATTVAGFVGLIISIGFGYSNLILPSVAILASPLLVYILYERTEYEITDEKVIMNRNIGGETHKEVQFHKIQNTTVTKPLLYQLVGNYGNIQISTAGSNRTAIKLSSIEDPKDINRKIVNTLDTDTNSDDNSDIGNTNVSYDEYQKLREASEKLRDNIIGGNYE